MRSIGAAIESAVQRSGDRTGQIGALRFRQVPVFMDIPPGQSKVTTVHAPPAWATFALIEIVALGYGPLGSNYQAGGGGGGGNDLLTSITPQDQVSVTLARDYNPNTPSSFTVRGISKQALPGGYPFSENVGGLGGDGKYKGGNGSGQTYAAGQQGQFGGAGGGGGPYGGGGGGGGGRIGGRGATYAGMGGEPRAGFGGGGTAYQSQNSHDQLREHAAHCLISWCDSELFLLTLLNDHYGTWVP